MQKSPKHSSRYLDKWITFRISLITKKYRTTLNKPPPSPQKCKASARAWSWKSFFWLHMTGFTTVALALQQSKPQNQSLSLLYHYLIWYNEMLSLLYSTTFSLTTTTQPALSELNYAERLYIVKSNTCL